MQSFKAFFKLEIVFMKHCAPLHVHEDGALLTMLLIILNQLIKFEAPIYSNFRDILFTSF